MKTKSVILALLLLQALALTGCATIKAARQPHPHHVTTHRASLQAIASAKTGLAEMQAASVGQSFTFPAQR